MELKPATADPDSAPGDEDYCHLYWGASSERTCCGIPREEDTYPAHLDTGMGDAVWDGEDNVCNNCHRRICPECMAA